jgi:radical SAM superfamily enzyme YgiQ (UPF0313 family)
MEKTLKFALKLNPDYVTFNILVPYPGTPIYYWAKEKGYLIQKDWRTYDGSHCLVNLPTLEPEKMIQFNKRASGSFYGRPKYIFAKVSKD